MDRKGPFVPKRSGAARRHPPVRVALLALPECSAAVLLSLYEVLQSVGQAWTLLTGEPEDYPIFEPVIISPDGKPLTCLTGLRIAPHKNFSDGGRFDVTLITDVLPSDGTDPRTFAKSSADWIRSQYQGGATVCSVCTGTLVLANTGLLNGQPATTHWAFRDRFRQYFPEVQLQPERILVVAGEGSRIVTAGGSASWEDLVLYLISRFSSPLAAVRAAKIHVIGDRSSGQLAYAAMMKIERHDDAAIASVQEWIADHYMVDNPVQSMIGHSGLAARTFKRRFKAATGYTPMLYTQTLRVEEAKQLLETTDQPTDAIAIQVGYDDPSSFRRLFKRETGLTPALYRRKFRHMLPSLTT